MCLLTFCDPQGLLGITYRSRPWKDLTNPKYWPTIQKMLHQIPLTNLRFAWYVNIYPQCLYKVTLFIKGVTYFFKIPAVVYFIKQDLIGELRISDILYIYKYVPLYRGCLSVDTAHIVTTKQLTSCRCNIYVNFPDQRF